jgi:hypothetical protein
VLIVFGVSLLKATSLEGVKISVSGETITGRFVGGLQLNALKAVEPS